MPVVDNPFDFPGVNLKQAINLSYTPVITAGSGTFTTVSATGVYYVLGSLVLLHIDINITTNGTAALNVQSTLPLNATAIFNNQILPGREYALIGKMLQGIIFTGSPNIISIVNYDNTYPGANGNKLAIQGFYVRA